VELSGRLSHHSGEALMADLLAQRQKTTAWFQHSMSDFALLTHGGEFVVSAPTLAVTDVTQSRIRLYGADASPGYNARPAVMQGCKLINKGIQFRSPARPSAVNEGLALECVFLTTVTAFNFFGGAWGRNIVRYLGPYAYDIAIDMSPLNDDPGSTVGVARCNVGDIGGTHIAVHTKVRDAQINDGRSHHLCITHAPAPQATGAVKMYVDGELTWVCDLIADKTMFSLEADCLNAGVENYFTHPDGDISHLAASPATAVSEVEIRNRANLARFGFDTPQATPGRNPVLGKAGDKWVQVLDGSRRKVKT
jgi:hypothetical protein